MTRLWKMELNILNIFIILLIFLNNTFTLMNATDPDQNWNNKSIIKSSNESFTGGILRLSDNVVPKHYKIELELFIEEDVYHGTSTIKIIINNATNIIHLHSENLTIFVPTLTENNEKTEHALHSLLYDKQMECFALYFEQKLLPGNYTLNIDFIGHINNNVGGFFKTSYTNEKGIREWFIATYTWPARTRRVFPCWDEPRFKAKFTITVKHPVNYTAISNTPTLPLMIRNNVVVTRFVTTSAISTHLIVIMLCKLPPITLRNIDWWGRQHLVQNQTFAHNVIRNVTRYYENNWNQLKKFPILQHVAIPDLLDDGMTKWGLISYRDQDIIYNKKLDPIARKMQVAYSIGRKISRQWLSTIVSPLWWSYMWLNEGIATFFFGADVINKAIFPHISYLFVMQNLQESLHLDQSIIMNPLTTEIKNTSDINSLFSFSYFIKGPAIMRMLQHAIGNKVFRNGINRYLKRQSASLDDFWTDMKAAQRNKSTESEKFNIRNMMDPWTKQNSYPILLVVRYSNSAQLGIMNILPQNASDNWRIPVTYTTQTHLNFNNTLPNLWLKSGNLFRGHFFNSSAEGDWIIFNLQQTGYYRVRYNNENWLKIAQYLNSENYTKIHVLNRAQIIDDAFHFMISDQLDSSTFWKLISYLSRETSYIAWYPMIKAIEYMSYIFPFEENEYFKTMILNQLNPLLQKIGYKENLNDTYYTKCLRQEAAKWACVLGDNECKRQAIVKFQWHLTNPAYNKFLPWWNKWTYCNGLSIEDDLILKKIFNTYVDELVEGKDTKRLEYLACSNKYFLIVPTFVGLKSRFYNERILKRLSKDYISFFHYTIERHARNEFLLDYMLANWKEVKPKEISTTVALIDIINHVYSLQQLNKIMQFMRSMEMVSSLSVDHEYLNIEFSFNRKKIHGLINENFVKLLISKMQNKVDIRLSEIKKHENSYMYS